MNIPFIKYSKFFLSFSIVVTVVALMSLFFWGLKPGIDFTGGSLMELNFANNRPETSEVQQVLGEMDYRSVTIQKTGEKGLIIRTAFLTEDKHQEVLQNIKDSFNQDDNMVVESSFQTIGPSVSQQLRQRSLWAIILVSLGIIFYIAYAFRKVSKPVASWKYGALAIVAMIHDVLLVVGVFAFLGKFAGVEVDVAFVVAMLTVIGYSINDTIVVYDRIRENLLHHTSWSFADLVNYGLNQTMMRSINTTLTTLLPLLALYFFGGATIHNFVLALLIGIASGAYSSIFIASPLLVLVEKWQARRA
ncbi:MAG: protein translocase subunit SecF [Candidatus Magasanikbacteria bacterium CG10_big_fil_rev_8_21_14_0_10_36_32]|uniref:Protein-export membrane protein SecF n=1 Tax=Candidatus Magasanikbacteria bacterium CG10_big_fil_rev_8_21_14_0_10_36_32 TaxID=1974646 RepID=A0A2M6W5L4_9BACT|nr:MAG: protein translocase subunit SecF [Candidatus Magasanikbacteria bacterium CG10_big_fil_rev_8_21_14_0_10_36_32]